LPLYDSPRQAGIIAVNFRDDPADPGGSQDSPDELIGAQLCGPEDQVLLISTKGQAIRFPADDDQLRPMGRATSGVTGMKFRPGDELLSLSVIRAGEDDSDRSVFTVTDGGFAKRTRVSEYREQGRGGLGIKAMKLNEDRGSLVGGLVVTDNDEVIAIKASGQITRSAVSEVPVKGRDTMGVKFVGVADDDSVVVIALNPETAEDPEIDPETTENVTDPDQSAAAVVEDTSTDSAESGEGDPTPASGDSEPEAGDGVEEDEQ